MLKCKVFLIAKIQNPCVKNKIINCHELHCNMNPILRKNKTKQQKQKKTKQKKKTEKLIKNAIGTEKNEFLTLFDGVSKVRGVSLSILLMTELSFPSIAGRRSDSGDYLHVFGGVVVANFRN